MKIAYVQTYHTIYVLFITMYFTMKGMSMHTTWTKIIKEKKQLNGTPLILHIKVCLRVLRSITAFVNKLYEAFYGSRGNCTQSDEVPQVTKFQAVSVGPEEYKF